MALLRDPVRRGRVVAAVRLLVLVCLLGAAVFGLLRHGDDLAAALRRLSAWAVLAGFVPALLAAGVSVLVWRTSLGEMGERLPLSTAAEVFYVSQLGKYVPGSVWSIVIQSELNRAHRIPRRSSLATGVLVVGVAVTTGLGLGVVTLPLVPGSPMRRYWWLVLLLPPLLAALHPRVLAAGSGALLRLVRRPPLLRTPSWAGMGRLAALQTGVWVCLGTLSWLLLVGSGAPPGPSALVAVGGYALAHSLGLLAVGLPAGAGVRDAVLALALSTVVPAPTAVMVALVARAVLTVVDLVLAGGAFAVARAAGVSRRRSPAPGPVPER